MIDSKHVYQFRSLFRAIDQFDKILLGLHYKDAVKVAGLVYCPLVNMLIDCASSHEKSNDIQKKAATTTPSL